ncbi:MAG: replicative DNA helicase [Desulfovibrio sp.]|nr:replicative DNA helicase [Desulfovibrio sp.]
MSQTQDYRSSGDQSSGGAFHSQRTTGQKAEQDLLKRVPPNSQEAEIAVLASMFTDKDGCATAIEIIKSADDFYDPRHVVIFRACQALFEANRPVDLVTCAEQLKTLGLYDKAGGSSYLSELSMAIVSAAHVEFYAKMVRDRATQRKLIDVCSEIISNSYQTTDDVAGLLDKSEHAVFSITERMQEQTFESTKKIIDNLFERLSKAAGKRDELTGVTTGFGKLDHLTAGLQPSDLIIVAARPSMGKTAFALSLAVNAALSSQATPVAIFSLEMSREQLVQRMLALTAHVDMSKLRQAYRLTDEDWNLLYEAGGKLNGAPIYIDDTATLSTMELRARVRRLKAKYDIGLVVVDYLQLMRSPRGKDSRELEISDISRTLKAVAKDLNIPVVALSQLNRKVEERAREDKRPQMSDLRESGAIEQDADIIMFIYRDDVYKHKNPADRPEVGKAEIIIGKQRNGPTGIAELVFHSRYTSFENLTEDWLGLPSESLASSLDHPPSDA